MTENTALFSAGALTATSATVIAFSRNRADVMDYLARHLNGDWGNVATATFLSNVEGIAANQEIRSEFTLEDETTFCIITNSSRSETCISLFGETITEKSF